MSYTIGNLTEVDDSAMQAVGAEQTGLAYHRIRSGKRQAFSR